MSETNVNNYLNRTQFKEKMNLLNIQNRKDLLTKYLKYFQTYTIKINFQKIHQSNLNKLQNIKKIIKWKK